MHLRNNFAAHSGIENYEAVQIALVLPPKKKSGMPFWLHRELFQADMLVDPTGDIEALVKHVQHKVNNKIDQLQNKILLEEILPKGGDYWYRKAKVK